MDTLLELIDRLPARGRLEGWWNAPVGSLEAHGVPSSALPVFAAWLAMRAQRPVLALVSDPEGSFQEAGAWFREDVRTVVFPAVETLPFDRLAPDEETVRRRLEALDAVASGDPLVAFSSWTAITRPTLGVKALQQWSFTLKPGQTYALDDLLRRLTPLGYRREPLVQARGEFSLRGGILDCFPPGRRRPLRAEFFGDELESLREFEVEGQGSVGSLAAARILPAAELILTPEAVQAADIPLRELDFGTALPEVRDQWLSDIERVRSGAYFDGIEGFQVYLRPSQPTLLDHLPAGTLILAIDARRSLAQAEQREKVLAELVAVEVERGELAKGLRAGLGSISTPGRAAPAWRTIERARGGGGLGAIHLGFEAGGGHGGRIDAFSGRGRTDARGKSRVLIVTQQEPRLRERLGDRDVYPAGGV